MFVDHPVFEGWSSRYRKRLIAEASPGSERKERMRRINPKYVLRNYLAQTAISYATEKKDFSEIERLLKVLRDPYSEQLGMERYAEAPPDWGRQLVVSCSS
jgi:hypothetical protein